jgi:hypothetical protein
MGAYVDAQYGWLYAWTNFNSVQFATSPAVELTTAVGIRPTLGPFDFDVGAAYTATLGFENQALSAAEGRAAASASTAEPDRLSFVDHPAPP